MIILQIRKFFQNNGHGACFIDNELMGIEAKKLCKWLGCNTGQFMINLYAVQRPSNLLPLYSTGPPLPSRLFGQAFRTPSFLRFFTHHLKLIHL